MSKQYLFKRKQGWYFRIAIPERVRHLYGGSNLIVKTLKTRDLKVAQERKIPMLLHYKEKFRKAVQNLEQAEGPDTCRFLGEWTYLLGLAAGRCRGAVFLPSRIPNGTKSAWISRNLFAGGFCLPPESTPEFRYCPD